MNSRKKDSDHKESFFNEKTTRHRIKTMFSSKIKTRQKSTNDKDAINNMRKLTLEVLRCNHICTEQ